MTTAVAPPTIPVYCVNCGDSTAHAITKRCVRCLAVAVPAQTLDSLTEQDYRTVAAAQSRAAEERPNNNIELPDVPETHRWFRATERYAEALTEQAATATAESRAAAAHAKQLRAAAEGISDLVKRLGVNTRSTAAPLQRKHPPAECIGCHRAWDEHVQHRAHGRCTTCDTRWRKAGKP